MVYKHDTGICMHWYHLHWYHLNLCTGTTYVKFTMYSIPICPYSMYSSAVR